MKCGLELCGRTAQEFDGQKHTGLPRAVDPNKDWKATWSRDAQQRLYVEKAGVCLLPQESGTFLQKNTVYSSKVKGPNFQSHWGKSLETGRGLISHLDHFQLPGGQVWCPVPPVCAAQTVWMGSLPVLQRSLLFSWTLTGNWEVHGGGGSLISHHVNWKYQAFPA